MVEAEAARDGAAQARAALEAELARSQAKLDAALGHLDALVDLVGDAARRSDVADRLSKARGAAARPAPPEEAPLSMLAMGLGGGWGAPVVFPQEHTEE